MKKTLFLASLCLATAGWAIELSPASLSAETPLVVQQPDRGVSAPASQLENPSSRTAESGSGTPTATAFKTSYQCQRNEQL